MLRKKEISVVLLLAIFCSITGLAEEQKLRTITTRDPKTGRTTTKQVPITSKQADPYENTSVLVEAFVVRVSTEALAEVGVNPIGQSPEGISILKILSCLNDPDKSEVVSGTKLTARNGKGSSLKNTERIYVKTERGNSVNYNEFKSGKTFEIAARLKSEKEFSIEYTYSESSFDESEDEQSPPATFTNNWSGTITMSTGKPIIAGAVQDDEAVTFLILTATIQD